MDIVKRDSKKVFKKNSLLIPRGIRKNGKIYKLEKDTNVSTNFIVMDNINEYQSIIIGTWMTTIFYQLNCEVQSKDQEGMRKMEKIDIFNTYVPKLNIMEEEFRKLEEQVKDIDFLNLREPEIRNIDKLWSNIIFKDKDEEEIENILLKSKRLLKYISNKRNK